jgi:hypothetical protein|tara:strand:- start:204 stop:515 length:312 start_codon:yes stop_codon:yes gene_type:complete
MKIEVYREACCLQDDQSSNLTLYIEASDDWCIWELARAIGEARFLQFTGSHNIIDSYCAGRLLFSIPIVGSKGNVVNYAVPRNDKMSKYVTEPKINCLWPNGL